MALFGLNWEESKWPGQFCPSVPTFFTSKIGVKLPLEKKVPWHRRRAALGRVSNCHFFQKNAFFGQKKAFFQKVHFIEKCSVTKNTIFQCIKNNFLLSNPKLVFFTEFNLPMILWFSVHTCPGDLSTSRWVFRDNSTFPHHYSHVWWRIWVSQKLSLANYCTVSKIPGEFKKALKMTFLGLKTNCIFIIHTKE